MVLLKSNASFYIRGLDDYSSDEELNSVPLFKDYPDHLIYFAVGCYVIFIGIGIPGNLITILALINYKKVTGYLILVPLVLPTAYVRGRTRGTKDILSVRNATAIFIINLTLTDLLSCCLTFPVKISIFLAQHWFGGKVMCMTFPLLKFAFYECTVLNIIAITFNRYVMVSHPQIYPKIYINRNIIIMIFCIWLGGFTLMIPVLTEFWGRISLSPVNGFCTVLKGKDGSSPKILYIFMDFIFPFTFIIACYSRIIWIAKKSAKRIDNRSNTAAQSNSTDPNQHGILIRESSSFTETSYIEDNKAPGTIHWSLKRFKKTFSTTIKRPERPSKPTGRDKKLHAMTVAILITFFVSHLPAILLCFASNPYTNITRYLLIDVTTCINPIIYVVMSNQYRQAYNHLFKKCER